MCMCIMLSYCTYAKIRFHLGKLVQEPVSEGEKLRFRALETQNFPGGACLRTSLGDSWHRHSMFVPSPQTFTYGYAPELKNIKGHRKLHTTRLLKMIDAKPELNIINIKRYLVKILFT